MVTTCKQCKHWEIEGAASGRCYWDSVEGRPIRGDYVGCGCFVARYEVGNEDDGEVE